MIALLQPWWRDRTPRERWLLAGLAMLMAAVLLWLAVLRPLSAGRAAAQARAEAAAVGVGEARALVGAIRAAESRVAGTAKAPLPTLIEARLREAGIAAGTIEAQGDGSVRLVIAAVRAPILIGWLTALEQRDGLVVERAAIARNSDPSVNALLVLRTAR